MLNHGYKRYGHFKKGHNCCRMKRICSVASLAIWGIGARAPSSLDNSVHSVASAGLTVKMSKITKDKHVLHFRISRQKHAKTHENKLKQSQN